MNNKSSAFKLPTHLTSLNKSYLVPFLFISLFVTMCVLISSTTAFAQTTKWRYVMTATGGRKTYLNDEIKNLPDRHKGAWEKMIDPDGSSVVVLAEYDCANKRRTPKQLSFYDSDGALTNIRKLSPDWLEFAPDSIAVAFYARLCLPAQPIKWAQIINPRTPLRRLFGNDSEIIRIAYQGELFQIAPESGLGGWFNVVDSETQMDYWLPGDWFETIEVAQALKKRSVTAGGAATKATPTVRKQKPQKANAQSVKNEEQFSLFKCRNRDLEQEIQRGLPNAVGK